MQKPTCTTPRRLLCHHTIVPVDVLKRFAEDPKFTEKERKIFADTALIDTELRKLRTQAAKLTSVLHSLSPITITLAASPAITVNDCNHSQNLPGKPVASPNSSTDPSIKAAYTEAKSVAEFYRSVFGRNSIDDAGMTIGSSVHFGIKYNNAFWNGSRMAYGDGDGKIFIDFTKSNDVICHELTHGVTQHTLHLGYSNEAGGLNESLSDVFGTMYRQWQADQTVNDADWLIGHDILGPEALARNFTCLRDMANPKASHCLAPQPSHYSEYKPGMDPHYSSGVPNNAFYRIAMALGGKSWEKVGQVWYKVMISSKPSPKMKMKTFATRTKKLALSMYPSDKTLHTAFQDGWHDVGL